MSIRQELEAMQTSRVVVETHLTPEFRRTNIVVKTIGVPVGWIYYATRRAVGSSATDIIQKNIKTIVSIPMDRGRRAAEEDR